LGGVLGGSILLVGVFRYGLLGHLERSACVL